MTWAEDKAREAVTSALPGFNPDDPPFTLVRAVERAIRETVEACARAVEDAGGDNEEYHAEAIRKLEGAVSAEAKGLPPEWQGLTKGEISDRIGEIAEAFGQAASAFEEGAKALDDDAKFAKERDATPQTIAVAPGLEEVARRLYPEAMIIVDNKLPAGRWEIRTVPRKAGG